MSTEQRLPNEAVQPLGTLSEPTPDASLQAVPSQAEILKLTSGSRLHNDSEKGYWRRLSGESTELYEHLGVRWFKKHIPISGDADRQRVQANGGRAAGGIATAGSREERLEGLIAATKDYEKIHLGWFAGFLAVTAAVEPFFAHSTSDHIGIAVASTIFNVTLNVYPIFVQRYNRLRAYDVLARMPAQPEAVAVTQEAGTLNL